MKDKLGTLLKVHFKSIPVNPQLDNLENNVWKQIGIRSRKSWLEQLLVPILVPRYRFATITLALVVGLSIGELAKSSLGEPSTEQALNMQVFSAQDIHLPTNKLKGKL